MKPISLKIKGLNSFSEEQEIDFLQLASRGFFGIFGPTGSGKTSILDGITLALYGKTARDSDQFVNMSCNAATVHFRFQISGATPTIYGVDRTIKMEKNGSKKTTHIRLVETKNGAETVLGDQERVVTKACQEIIGLSYEDFTRTVLLPQGRFSEFLLLEGKPRRDMLERLFGLEKYGEELSRKLSKAIGIRREEEHVLSGRLQEVGEAREERLTGMESAEKRVSEEIKETAEKKVSQEGLCRENNEVWNLQLEKKELEDRWENVLKQEEEMRALAEETTEEEGILRVQPIYYQREKLKKQVSALSEACIVGEKEEKTLFQEKEFWEKEWNRRNHKKSIRIPELTLRNEELRVIVEKKQKIRDEERDITALRRKIEEYERKKRANSEEFSEKEKGLVELREKVQKYDAEIEKLQFPEDYKEKIQLGLLSIERITAIRARLKEFESEKQYLSEKNISRKAELEASLKERLNVGNKLETAEGVYKLLEARIEEARNMQGAALLRKNLQEGQPCPVCGSTEHPIQAALCTDSKSWTELQEEKEVQNQEIKKYREEFLRMESLCAKTQEALSADEQQFSRIDESSAAEKEKERAEEILITEIKNVTGIQEILQSQLELSQGEKHRKALEGERRVLLNTYEEHSKVLRELQEQINGWNLEWAKETATLQEKERAHMLLKEQLVEDGSLDPERELAEGKMEIQQLTEDFGIAEKNLRLKTEAHSAVYRDYISKKSQLEELQRSLESSNLLFEEAARRENLNFDVHWENSLITVEAIQKKKEALTSYQEEKQKCLFQRVQNTEKLRNRVIQKEEKEESERLLTELGLKLQTLTESGISLRKDIADLKEKILVMKTVLERKAELEHELALLKDLENLFKGKRFVEFLAMYQLRSVSAEASKRLFEISNGNYGLEVDGEGQFKIRDYKNGGATRSASTLSGGEVFLASLSLALALSALIQLKGKAPLELFFLDEGFGTLDEGLLDMVIESLERIHHERLRVGIISHVESIKNRVPMKLMVSPAILGVRGSRAEIEEN